jgi:hypothetical protein
MKPPHNCLGLRIIINFVPASYNIKKQGSNEMKYIKLPIIQHVWQMGCATHVRKTLK